MRFRTLAIAAALSAGLIQTGSAFAPQKGVEQPTVVNGRGATHASRHRCGCITRSGSPAGRRLSIATPIVPVRMWGPSIAMSGTTADPAVADTSARAFLRDHLAELAPGALLSDFTPLANVLDPSGTIRTVTYAQHAQGLARRRWCGQLHVRARSPRHGRLDRAAERLGRSPRRAAAGADDRGRGAGAGSSSRPRSAATAVASSCRSYTRAATRSAADRLLASSRRSRSRPRAARVAGTCGSTRADAEPVARHTTLMFAQRQGPVRRSRSLPERHASPAAGAAVTSHTVDGAQVTSAHRRQRHVGDRRRIRSTPASPARSSRSRTRPARWSPTR